MKIEIKNKFGKVLFTVDADTLVGANLYANLKGANLYDANLKGANLVDAFLEDVNLSGANLKDVNFGYDADIEGAGHLFGIKIDKKTKF